ncbi:hypothetical protein [Xylanibacter muris]|uniref:hypothetical protein n=1 Tax=Xylanibacter muris TaxID=2736290 RepID=UPI002557E309|nr:hypothetical protein [Xylanibacter muris]
MEIKRTTTSIVLLFLMFSVAQAQDIKADSIGSGIENWNEQTGYCRPWRDPA